MHTEQAVMKSRVKELMYTFAHAQEDEWDIVTTEEEWVQMGATTVVIALQLPMEDPIVKVEMDYDTVSNTFIDGKNITGGQYFIGQWQEETLQAIAERLNVTTCSSRKA